MTFFALLKLAICRLRKTRLLYHSVATARASNKSSRKSPSLLRLSRRQAPWSRRPPTKDVEVYAIFKSRDHLLVD